MEKLIVGYRGDRLGGRLNTLINSLRISRKTGMRFSYFWSKIENREYEINEYRDLFTEEFLEKNLNAEEFRSLRPRLARLPQRPRVPLDSLISHSESSAGWIVSGTRAYVFPGEDPEEVRRELWQAFHDIGFRPELMKEIGSIEQSMRTRKSIALHIRRGDVLWPQFRWMPSNKYRPTILHAEFIRRRQSAGECSDFVIFSDDPEVYRDFKKRFRNVKSKEDYFDTASYSEIQIALLDIVLMINCNEIVGPGGSVFSNFAEILSGVDLKPISELFDQNELQDIIYRSLSQRLGGLHGAGGRERMDFVMDVKTVFNLSDCREDLERWLPFVHAARACDPDNCALEHVLARIEEARGDKVSAAFHYSKVATCAALLPVAGRWPQKYAFDAAKSALELFESEIEPTFPLHSKRSRLLDDAGGILEAAVPMGASDGRMEAALAEVRVLQGQLASVAELLSASAGLSAPEDREGFRRLFGRLLLGGGSLRHQARQQLKIAARQEETADLAAALLYRLHRQDGDETGMRRALRRRPSAREAYPWLLEEGEGEEAPAVDPKGDDEEAWAPAAED